MWLVLIERGCVDKVKKERLDSVGYRVEEVRAVYTMDNGLC